MSNVTQPQRRSPTPEDSKKFSEVHIEHDKLRQADSVVYYVDGERRVYVPDSPEERRLRRKIDIHMFSCVSVLYLLNYLDRQNVSMSTCSICSCLILCYVRSGMPKLVACRTISSSLRLTILSPCKSSA
jgi:hypothetical protein